MCTGWRSATCRPPGRVWFITGTVYTFVLAQCACCSPDQYLAQLVPNRTRRSVSRPWIERVMSDKQPSNHITATRCNG